MKRPASLLNADIAIRAAFLAALWWLMVGGRTDAWLVGLPTVALATWASVHLSTHRLPGISLTGLARFLVLFIRESLRGGLDVACRTLGLRLGIEPGFKCYPLKLNDPFARVFMINCISLLPGTLSVELNGDDLELHLLDSRQNPEPQLRDLEVAIQHLFKLNEAPNHV
ncbi:MAG TPA: Na+/H+ antiporter subunit E [Gammaproteobacteria bacterium]